ncbi:PaaI family thioesterase [Corynebacterium sp. HMSC06C06]|uniref:PaaI family thioesterase n=1 Tax=Corynebacterium sp. HMSC06C06 TaxID=1581121 RepID=UPI000AFE1E92|nr:PaaI family thioesterase [Corynebacterium sp. HMSC06C06]
MSQENPDKFELMAKMVATVQERPLSAEEIAIFNAHNHGLGGLLGLDFTFVSKDEVRAQLEVKPEHHQPWGAANGGLYCSIAESVGSIASFVAAAAPVVGINNNTDFIRSVSDGILEAVAIPVQLGRRTHIWCVEMRQAGKLIARTNLRTMVNP